MQHEIVRPGDLLDSNGALRECGWAKRPLLAYDRTAVRAHLLRIKEWDYYLIYDDEVGVALTVDDNGYMGLFSASYLDFTRTVEHTQSSMCFMPLGKIGLPASSGAGTVSGARKGILYEFIADEHHRELTFRMDRFLDGKPFAVHIELTDIPQDSMVIATPFAQEPTAFYYNQKIVGMTARGEVECSMGHHVFASALGLLDWGRGVWTYDNTWYWGAAQGEEGGHRIGFNIGYGFGDTTAASENMFFVDGVAHKLDRLTFNIPGDGTDVVRYTDPWTFTSSDGRFEMEFVPLLDRAACTTAGPLMSDQHQVFGYYSGRITCDDGRIVSVTDLLGFAEKVRNKW